MNLRIATLLFVIVAVAQATVMAMVATADASDRNRYSQFYYNSSDPIHPLLDAPFDYFTSDADNVTEERYGHLYIYCNKTSLKKFFFSSIVTTKIADYFAKQEGVVIGFKSVSDDYDIPLHQLPITESKEEGMERLGFDYYEPIYLDEVRDFSPTHLSDNTSLYGRSFVDAKALDIIKNPTLISVAYYDEDANYFYVISQVLVKTDPKYVKQFVTACTPKEQPQ